MWEPEKVTSLGRINGIVMAEFSMHIIQLDGTGAARVEVAGVEYWFDGLARGYIDDRIYNFKGIIEPAGTKTYSTILNSSQH